VAHVPEKLLRVVAPKFVAGAIWRKENGIWRCVDAAPIIKWMIGKSAEQVADYLKKKQPGWTHSWH